MRTLLLASIAVLAFAHLAHAQGGPPSFTQTPVTEEFLRQLDNEQLRLLRLALRGCAKPGALRADGDPCVTLRTDEAVTQSGNPDLEAFHKALPASDRYDETRSSTIWRAWLKGN